VRTHGIRATYTGGCRCAPCTEAQRAWHEEFRHELAARPRDAVPHGGSGYLNWSCRCEVCKAAGREHNARTRARRARRNGKPLTPLQAEALANAGGV
jgi:hypothetical protein